MKFLLTSWDFQNENSKKIILENLPKPIEDCTVLFIPNEKAYPRRIKNGTYMARLVGYGFAARNAHVFDYWHPELTKGLSVDVVYIGGGNTFATLARMRETGMDKEVVRLIREGAVYVGASAGVHIVTTDLSHVTRYDPLPEGYADLTGLGLLTDRYICHFDETRRAHYDELTRDGKPVYTIANDECIVVNI